MSGPLRCDVCGVIATHTAVRKRGPEPLCGEHLEWLQANTSTALQVTAIVATARPQRRTTERKLLEAASRERRREQIRAYDKASYQRHRADRIRKAREYAAEHRDQRRAYYQRNRERRIANAKAYYQRNREAALVYQSVRREQRKAAGKAFAA